MKYRWTYSLLAATISTMSDPVRIPPVSAAGVKQVRFVELSVMAMTALLNNDLRVASIEAGITLTDYFTTDNARRLWQRRLTQLTTDPSSARWIVRAAVAEPEGWVVGYAGFHGPPDALGMVEVGYSVAEPYRRQGYGRAILTALLRRAANEPGVSIVRATISPDNIASLATIRRFAFTPVGEQWDDEDGLELIFETPATTG